jgi:two-component system sensor kinase FixL
MANKSRNTPSQAKALAEIEAFVEQLGPFVVAADKTRMPMLFTDAQSSKNEIVYVNESFVKLSRYKRHDLIGKPISEILAKAKGNSTIKEEILVNAVGKPSVRVRCVQHGGREFDAAVFVSPVNDKNGILHQYFVCFVDLTEHLEAQRSDQLRTNKLYKYAPGFIALTRGKEHRFAFANQAYESLIGRRAPVGKRAAEVLPELLEQGFIEILDQVYKSGRHYSSARMPFDLNCQPGRPAETRYVQFVYQPVRDEEGNVTGIFCEGSDITNMETTGAELEVAEAQLVHLSRVSAMGTMAATLGHELNQPLAAITNYAAGCSNLLAKSGLKTGELQDGLEAIGVAASRAGNIIRALREMTRKAAPRAEQFPLGSALAAAAALVRAGSCEGLGINIKIESSGCVRADRIQIEQVIVNLLQNACDALTSTDSRGSITGTVLSKNEEIGVVIQDDGPGVSANALESLFEWAESSKTNGMGLGLSISRTIIESNGGRIDLDHTGKAGASFSFWLPELVC